MYGEFTKGYFEEVEKKIKGRRRIWIKRFLAKKKWNKINKGNGVCIKEYTLEISLLPIFIHNATSNIQKEYKVFITFGAFCKREKPFVCLLY